ncbi:MAG: EcsC family protein [Bacteroidia bacterium]|nr:EcsC family protein [Bacteroidia bacterium]
MAKLNSSDKQILEDIALWKSNGPGFFSQATEFISKPISWAGDKLIPEEVKSQMGRLTETIVDKLHDLSKWTVKEEEVLKATREFEIDSDTIIALKKASIQDLDHVSEKFIKTNCQLGAAEGFGTGLIGWPGLIADLPALFTLCMREIYQISLCYGYAIDEHGPESAQAEFEIGYMLRIFRVATASTKVEKTKALLDLKDFEVEFNPEVSQDLGNDYARKQIGKSAAINLSRMIVNEIIRQTLARKAVTFIPGIGAVLTAGFNYAYISDVGQAAFMLYRERFLLDKKGRKQVINIEID